MIRWQKAKLVGACGLFYAAIFLSLPGSIRAQTQAPAGAGPCNSADGAKAADGKPCSSPKSPPSVSEQFPYPGETKEPEELPATPSKAAADAPTGSKSIKDQFPYPGEAPDPASSTGNKGAANAGGESSSSSGADAPPPDVDDKPALKDEGTQGSTAQGRRRLRPPAQKILSDDERVEEDLSVAHFYQQTGNLSGAYLRTKDAVKLQPQAADAHLALAEVAQKMGKRDEAIAEYTRYLELEPDGDGVKTARKSLERLKP